MRRIYDDVHYDSVSKAIEKVLESINPKTVSIYSYGSWRSNSGKIRKVIKEQLPQIKFGRYTNTTGIGNNESYEIIYIGDPKEEQICGEIHLTNNMYGSTICWVSDIDRKRSTKSIRI